MEACNLDTRGARQRRVAGVIALLLGLGASAWMIATDQPLALRIVVALVLFGFATLSLCQAAAKT